MKEIEAKFKIKDENAFKGRLEEIGAIQKSSLNQTDTYFTHKVISELAETRTFLRVRSSNAESYVSFHYKLENYIWEELETMVSDGDELREIFRLTGKEIDVEVRKYRQVFYFNHTEIVLDQVDGLGLFAEIEAKSLVEMKNVCSILNLDLQQQAKELEGQSYADLLKAAILTKKQH